MSLNQSLGARGRVLVHSGIMNDEKRKLLSPFGVPLLRASSGLRNEYSDLIADPLADSTGSNTDLWKRAKFPAIVFCPGVLSWLAFLLFSGVTAFALTDSGADFVENHLHFTYTHEELIKYFSIPVVSVVFTYAHIWLALYMTFYPIEFVGCCQIPGTNVGVIGWQGIIPFKAVEMATTACKLMTEKLIDVREVFGRLNPEKVSEELDTMLQRVLGEVTEEVANEVMPDVWAMLPVAVKGELISKAHEDTPNVIRKMMAELQDRTEEVMDLEHMVIHRLSRDKELLCNVFIKCGFKELEFIRNAGGWMGLIFGLLQMVAWFFYKEAWVLPVVGLVVGTFTNWFALKIIFRPIDPIYCCCKTIKIQGLFLRRQMEVSAEYGRIVANRVMTPRNLFAAMLSGPTTDRVFEIMSKHMQDACDDYAGLSSRFLKFAAGERYQLVKDRIVGRMLRETPAVLAALEDYAREALDMETLLREKLSALSSRDFENILHPVFESDEWKLVVCGGCLGVVIGTLQAIFLEG